MAPDKTKFWATRNETKDALQEVWGGLGFYRAESVRNLGSDASLRQRSAKVRAGRISMAKRRNARAKRLRAAGEDVGCVAGGDSSLVALWGSGLGGVPLGRLDMFRASSAKALASLSPGQSVYLFLQHVHRCRQAQVARPRSDKSPCHCTVAGGGYLDLPAEV